MAAARVGHHSSPPFAPHSVSRKSTHPVGGSNRDPPEAVPDATTEHFGQATGAINECLLASEGDSCPFLKLDLCVSMVQRTMASRLVRFLLVTLVIVKEASDLSFQRGCLLRIPDGTGAVEEFPLQLRGNGVRAHDHGRAEALQDLLVFVSKGGTVVALLSPLNRLIDMNRHRFFVFGKRHVGVHQIAEFTRVVHRTWSVDEECPEFGCFRSELVRSRYAAL
jgi:hypothetical protein